MSKVLKIIDLAVDKIQKNEEYLTELDRKIGDGDHGVNMARGCKKIIENRDSLNNLKEGELFSKLAMLTLSNVGGASGALYASAFMKVASYLKDKEIITENDIENSFKEAIDGIRARGKSERGEKTLLDTLIPAYEEIKSQREKSCNLEGVWEEILLSAKEGMESTKGIIATKGRASFLGERSIGHLDPGAVSSFLILSAIAEVNR